MTDRKKEIAKFFAGVAANQTIVHWGLGLSDVLPLTLLGMTYTTTLNTAAMVAWPVIAILLVHYAWIRK